MTNLDLANAVRTERADLKKLIATGQITLDEATSTSVGLKMRLDTLIGAQRYWTRHGARHLLVKIDVSPEMTASSLSLVRRAFVLRAVHSHGGRYIYQYTDSHWFNYLENEKCM